MWTAEQISNRFLVTGKLGRSLQFLVTGKLGWSLQFLVTGKLGWSLQFLHKPQWVVTGVLAAWSRQSCKVLITGNLYRNNLYT
jgi:hypothetical protein